MSSRAYRPAVPSYRTYPVRVPIDVSPFHIFPTVEDLETYVANQDRVEKKLEYGRYGNTTTHHVAKELIRLEAPNAGKDHYDAVLTSDGMRAVTCTFNAILADAKGAKPPHIIVGTDCYKKIRQFIESRLVPDGVQCTALTPEQFEDLGSHIQDNTCFVFIESPSNPFLRIVDIGKAASITRRAGVPLIVDTTFATPVNQRPLELGATIVIHSVTKYLSGHNNLMGGAVIGDPHYLRLIKDGVGLEGGVMDPEAAFRLDTGLKTLTLRVEEQNRRALTIARFLEDSSEIVERVWYPLLPSHPDYEIANRTLAGGAGVVTFSLRGQKYHTKDLLNSLRQFKISASFGGTDSLIQPVALISYYYFTEEQKRSIGISDTLIRLSVGVEENINTLIGDLANGLESIHRGRRPCVR